MANVNINRNLSDQFYRYKMPKLIAKVEGKGNGIKTVIVNMPEVAKSLNRPPMYPTKYFGCVLGAQVNFDNKSERYIVNGAHEQNKLQDLLDGFIQKYVLCQSCSNPETILSVNKKKETIGTNCMACGYSGTIPSASDRVASYILKNPPPKPAACGAASAAAPTAAAAAAASADPVVDVSKSSNKEEDDDEDWGEDTNEDAVRKRMDEFQLSSGAKSLMLNDDLEKDPDERAKIFYEFVADKLKNDNLTLIDTQKAVKAEADRLDISDKAVIVLCEVLFKDVEDKILEKIKLYQKLFLRFTYQNTKAQKNFLRGIVFTISEKKDKLLPRVHKIFDTLYDENFVEEDVFLDWYNKHKRSSKKTTLQIMEQATPFITWLQEASEESDEDDEDKVDIDFDDRIVGDAIKVEEDDKPTNSNPKQPSSNNINSKTKTNQSAATSVTNNSKNDTTEPDEDEINIDDI